MASNLRAMASTLVAIASYLIALASNLRANHWVRANSTSFPLSCVPGGELENWHEGNCQAWQKGVNQLKELLNLNARDTT